MFFDRKEKEVESLFLDHFEKVGNALTHLKEMLSAYLVGNKDFKEASLRVHQSEHEADLVKQAIESKLYEGAFMPINRADYIVLAEFIDRIANQAEVTANLLVLTRPEVPDFLKEDLTLLLDRSIASFCAIREALLMIHKDLDKVKGAVAEATAREKEADKIEWEAIKKVFKSDLDLARKLHLRELIHDVTAISDQAEDAAERFGIMIVKQAI